MKAPEFDTSVATPEARPATAGTEPLIDADLVDAISAAAVSRPPRHVVGKRTACFSPVRYYALTQVHRGDVNAFDTDLFLTEEPLLTVHKKGIMLGGEWYFAPQLQMVTTGDKSLPQRKLVMRYDRSRLARGTLDEVRIWEVNADKSYTYLFTCGPREQVLEALDPDLVLRERERYLRQLLAERKILESEYVALVAGKKAEEDLLRGLAEQRRNQARNQPSARFVEPIWDSSESSDAGETLGAALRDEPAQSAGTDAATVRTGGGRTSSSAARSPGSTKAPKAPLGAALRGGSRHKK